MKRVIRLPFLVTLLISLSFWFAGWGNSISLFDTLRDPIRDHLRYLGQPGSTEAETRRLYQQLFFIIMLLSVLLAALLVWVMVLAEKLDYGSIRPLFTRFGSFWYLLVLLLALSWSFACYRIKNNLIVKSFSDQDPVSLFGKVNRSRLLPFFHFLEVVFVTMLCIQSFLYLCDSASLESNDWPEPISEVFFRKTDLSHGGLQSAGCRESWPLQSESVVSGSATFLADSSSRDDVAGRYLMRLTIAALAFMGLSVWIHCERWFVPARIIGMDERRRSPVSRAQIWDYCHRWARWIFMANLFAVLCSYVFICRSACSFGMLDRLSFSHYSVAFLLTLGLTLLIVWTRLGVPRGRTL